MYSDNQDTKELLDIARLTAISAVMLLFYRFAPMIGAVVSIFSSVPIAYTVITKRRKFVWLQGIATLIVIFILSGDPRLLLMFLMDFMILGICLGFAIKNRADPLTTVFLSSLILSVVFWGGIVILKLYGVDLQAQLITAMDKMFEQMQQIAKMPKSNLELVQQSLRKTLTVGFPGLVFTANLFHVVVAYLVVYTIVQDARQNVPGEVLLRMKANTVLIWTLIAAFAMSIPAVAAKSSVLAAIGYNLRFVTFSLLTLIGLSILNYAMSKMRISKAIKFIFNVIFLLQLWWMLAVVAILDYWMNFRKI